MEVIKNLLVGILVVVLACIVIGFSLLLFPIIFVAGSILLLSLKAVIFIAVCLAVITLIGYA
ncbi:MAG: hypothetical protein ABH885_03355, partial [Candidatus Omnitrophota bacterium]